MLLLLLLLLNHFSRVRLCDTMDCSPPRPFVHGNSPGKNTGVGCHALLQRIFPGSNPHLQRNDSLEKTLMLGKVEGRRRRLDGIINSRDMNLSKLREMVSLS